MYRRDAVIGAWRLLRVQRAREEELRERRARVPVDLAAVLADLPRCVLPSGATPSVRPPPSATGIECPSVRSGGRPSVRAHVGAREREKEGRSVPERTWPSVLPSGLFACDRRADRQPTRAVVVECSPRRWQGGKAREAIETLDGGREPPDDDTRPKHRPERARSSGPGWRRAQRHDGGRRRRRACARARARDLVGDEQRVEPVRLRDRAPVGPPLLGRVAAIPAVARGLLLLACDVPHVVAELGLLLREVVDPVAEVPAGRGGGGGGGSAATRGKRWRSAPNERNARARGASTATGRRRRERKRDAQGKQNQSQ